MAAASNCFRKSDSNENPSNFVGFTFTFTFYVSPPGPFVPASWRSGSSSIRITPSEVKVVQGVYIYHHTYTNTHTHIHIIIIYSLEANLTILYNELHQTHIKRFINLSIFRHESSQHLKKRNPTITITHDSSKNVCVARDNQRRFTNILVLLYTRTSQIPPSSPIINCKILS